jgi:type I restriction enzyme M protein
MENTNILQYESKIWKTADLLLGAGIKQSDFPKYMMPFFALIMVESRFIQSVDALKAKLQASGDSLSNEDFAAEIMDQKQGYNSYQLKKNKTLKDICKNDKSFETDFQQYLAGFDHETQDLLGVDKSNNEEKFLDISGISGLLKKKSKDTLFQFATVWSEIELQNFSNSEITTLEEHIKRKWADISAETAGEQYTPDDVIALIAEIISNHVTESEQHLTIYDPTCGGGNMLFGVEDRIREKFNRPTATYGQDWNDALYALAKIESRFRKNSHIGYGNTLTRDKFSLTNTFDVVVANPPYGLDWKGYYDDIKRDETGRFAFLPSISDGQLLFMQHIISKLDDVGVGVVVHNGSTLFSGDAGSSESNIRKWMLDSDIVEAVIQLPTDEFFNTGIYTYLWVLNKNKQPHQKDKVMLINASEKFKPLKKSKGSKRKEIDEASRLDIVETLTLFENNDYARVFDKEFFYFNKQAILLTNVDENGKTFASQLADDKTSLKLKPIKLSNGERELTEFTIFNAGKYGSLIYLLAQEIKPFIDSLNYKEQPLIITTATESYHFNNDRETLIKTTKGKQEALGCGKIIVKATYKKATSKLAERIEISVELTPDTQKDYEIIPFYRDEAENKQAIIDFMARYITKPFATLDNVVGVEINFNKVFYKPETLRPVTDILSDIKSLDEQLHTLETELSL